MILFQNQPGFNLIWQYTLVGIILLGVCVWIVIKVSGPRKNNRDHCAGCGLYDACEKKKIKINHGNHKDL